MAMWPKLRVIPDSISFYPSFPAGARHAEGMLQHDAESRDLPYTPTFVAESRMVSPRLVGRGSTSGMTGLFSFARRYY